MSLDKKMHVMKRWARDDDRLSIVALTYCASLCRLDIDFGFMLGISPGGVGFEAAPFKMPQEYIDIIGGLDSPKFVEFKSLVCQGFRDVRKHAERVIMMVELMQKGEMAGDGSAELMTSPPGVLTVGTFLDFSVSRLAIAMLCPW